jgi:hypothetical protein
MSKKKKKLYFFGQAIFWKLTDQRFYLFKFIFQKLNNSKSSSDNNYLYIIDKE